MNITLHSTSRLLYLNNTRVRIWEGKSDTNLQLEAFMVRLAINKPPAGFTTNPSHGADVLMQTVRPSGIELPNARVWIL
jgi:hypothetical protein